MRKNSATIFNIRPQTENIGNEVIDFCLKEIVSSAFPQNVNLVGLPSNKRGNGRPFGLSARSIYDINHMADGVILGSGNLYENGDLAVDANALKALRVPLLIFGVSWGEIFNKDGSTTRRTDSLPDDTIRLLSSIATRTLVRDQTTADHLTGLGLKDVEVVGCPTLFCGDVARNLPPPRHDVSNTALVSIRNPDRMSVHPVFQYRVYEDIKATCRILREHGYKDVKLLCHDYADLRFAEAFDDVDYLHAESVPDFLSILKYCKLNVSFRLHSFLPCLSMGTPAIALTYDRRAEALLETLGVDDWAVNIFDEANFHASIHNRIEEIDTFRQVIDRQAGIINMFRNKITGSIKTFAEEIRPYEFS